jgi:predicted amidophosphoribosyltransferase
MRKVECFLQLNSNMNLAKNPADWFRSCGYCSVSRTGIDLYCEYCWKNKFEPMMLNPKQQDFSFGNQGLQVTTLFRWGYANDSIGEMLRLLKGEYHGRAFERLAKSFSQRRSALGVSEPFVLVPSPPKIVGEADHAHLWAKALSQYWRMPLNVCLGRSSQNEQKQLSGLERRQRRMVRLKNEQGVEDQKCKIVFADDVYTTGSTAQAAYEALGRPKRFEVWAVACRPKLFQV